MDVLERLDRLHASHGPLFVVVGVFDGLHRGHAYLLRRLVRESRPRWARPAVVTFDAHPDEVLTGSAPPLLLDPDERVTRLAAAGVDVTVMLHFDRALRETPYDAFVSMLSSRCDLAGFLMTPDAAFGYQRQGTPDALAQLGARQGFEVVVVPPFVVDGRPVRSSEIRASIAAGDVSGARRLLGRTHAVVGSPDANGIVTFPLPVALPPEGDWTVRVAAPLQAGKPWRGTTQVATVEGATVRLPGARPDRKGLRIAFAGAAVGG